MPSAESALKYEKFKETHVEGDDEYSHEVESYLGLDSDGWHLPSIFKEYIPSLYRQSAFLTVWAMFESELNKLCDRYKNERGSRIAFSDIQGRGINQSTRYLEKVVGLTLSKSTAKEWGNIKKIQNLRNVIIHQNGSLSNRNSDQVKDVINYINQTDTLSGIDDGIEVKEGFLASVLEIFRRYFKLIGEAIKAEVK